MQFSQNEVGNKAVNLYKIYKKFNVPKFRIITVSQISKFLKKEGITEKNIKDAFNGDFKSRKLLRERIIKKSKNYSKYAPKQGTVIIRSSSIAEDGKVHSFAGIYESLKANKKNYGENFSKVLASAYSERVYHYIKKIGLKSFPKIAIIIQEYIKSDFGGIVFSTYRYKNKKGVMINLAKNGAENAVLGKKIKQVFIAENTNEKYSAIIKAIYNIAKEIEDLFGCPQDIELCVDNEIIYILQTRPITIQSRNDIIVWDNSNIAESYSGIVLPLTCSFAKHIYNKVYIDVALTSNINPKKVQAYSEIFNSLLGFFYGRFYYNMTNWYKMLTLFPGYKRNKKNLDMMISAKSKSDLDKEHKKNVTKWDEISYYIHIFFRIIRFEKDLIKFKSEVSKSIDRLKNKQLSSLTLVEQWKVFNQYEKELLHKWSLTVDNDFLAMTWFGAYKKYAYKYGLKDNDIVASITQMKNIISAEQVSVLRNISTQFNRKPKLVNLAKQEKYKECYDKIQKDESLNKQIKKYLEKYGGRFANELKLETPDLDSDPKYIVQLLLLYKNQSEAIYKQPRKVKLPFFRQKLLNCLSKRSKHYLRNREELRLLRSQAFAVTRKLFISIGKKLASKKIIQDYSDVFYLTLDEIEEVIKNPKKLIKIVNKRKIEYDKYSSIELDNVLFSKKGEIPKPKKVSLTKNNSILQGQGCSSGEVSGKITVMNKFELPKNKIDIAVVSHTDPGWTPLFGLVKGLIVEHGGLLSHAAIISRELGLPCVIGVKDATKILKNNQLVEMNGDTGVIKIGNN